MSVADADEPASAPLASALLYWESRDPRKLFAPKSVNDLDCDVQKIVHNRIEKLEGVSNRFVPEWRILVDGGDQNDVCSEHDIYLMQPASEHVPCRALRKFVTEVTENSRWTWQQCIEHSIAKTNDIGIETYSHWRPLAMRHRRLAYSPNGTFIKLHAPKSGLRPFFICNPEDAMNAFKKHGVSILKELTVERMHIYVLETLIPAMMTRAERCIEDIEEEEEDLSILAADTLSPKTKKCLQSYGVSKVSIATVVRWMHATGFRHRNRSKYYFVDGHEKPETLAYRPVFTKRYLANEVQAYCWIQLTLVVASKEL